LPEELLAETLGPSARFHQQQREAILAVAMDRRRILLVQKTGWGKTLVYGLACRMLRDAGEGYTLVISPLISLMRNQRLLIERCGVRCFAAHSDDKGSTDPELIASKLREGLDMLLVSPERLGTPAFAPVLKEFPIGLLVVDEAHCISDWGHDFRPDYRRIVNVVRNLPAGVPLVASTATANDRVIEDLDRYLGRDLAHFRGELARDSLRLSAVGPLTRAERMAWLADAVPGLPGSGVCYVSTVRDAEQLARWIRSRGIEARDYTSRSADREGLEQALLDHRVKVLCSTQPALGMGFDMPDMAFVIHYQAPASLLAYYQQVGRAGRAIDRAEVVLLWGEDDWEIQEHFIRTARPPDADLRAVAECLLAGPKTRFELEGALNLGRKDLERALKLMEIEGFVDRGLDRRKQVWSRTVRPLDLADPAFDRHQSHRRQELEELKDFCQTDACRMEYLARSLDDPSARRCGSCDNCRGERVPSPPAFVVSTSRTFLRRDHLPVKPYSRFPMAPPGWEKSTIPPELRMEEGRALALYRGTEVGQLVKEGKYTHGRFDDRLVGLCVRMMGRWKPDPWPGVVVPVPSLRHSRLVAGFASRLAQRLGMRFLEVVVKVRNNEPQKTRENTVQKLLNLVDAFALNGTPPSEPILLVDDVVETRYTLAWVACLLLEAGSGPVFPMVLAQTHRGDL